jgi:pimeloyl-ACP methyl ester carboxylesterase
VRCPVRLRYGEVDEVTPAAFGRWYAARLPGATLTVVPGAGHYVALTRWTRLLAELATLVDRA